MSKNKKDDKPVTAREQEESAKLAIRRWKQGGHDPHDMYPPIQRGDIIKIVEEEDAAKKHWWQR
jgi:hypothetical protein